MTRPLTTRQKEVLSYLNGYASEHGYMPTIREIGERFDITSPNGVVCHLRALEKKGCISRAPRVARAMRVAG